MPVRSTRQILSAMARTLLTRWARTPRGTVRRLRLGTEQLEPRLLMTVVEPHSCWSDDFVNPTVEVCNGGPGYVDVSGGGGSVSLAPYYGPTGNGDPPARSFSVGVEGQNGAPGDASWSGDADSVALSATGAVAGITLNGSLAVSAGRDIGPLSAARVQAFARGNLGPVTATGDIFSLEALGNIGPVQAGGRVGTVHPRATRTRSRPSVTWVR